MSSSSIDSSMMVAHEFEFLLERRMIFAVSAMTAYEYIITFDQEVTTVWRRSWTASSILLLSTRWVMLGFACIQCIALLPTKNCLAVSLISNILSLLGALQVAVFSALRIVAVTGRSYILAMVVLALGFVPISLTIAMLPEVKFQEGCNMILEISQNKLLLLGLFSRLSTILADFLVVAVTWHRTFRGWSQLSKCKSLWTVSDCLLRDGAIYFVALLLVNAAQVLTHNPTFNPVSVLTSALPLILVNRFMLNLRQVQPARSFPSGSTAIPPFLPGAPDAEYGTFTSIIGNIGESLVHAHEEQEDGEGEAEPSSPIALSEEERHA